MAMGSPAQAHRVVSDNTFGNGVSIYLGDIHHHSTITDRPETPPQPFVSIPFSRDPEFVHRGDVLERIDQRCSLPAGRVALVGLGGIGKSQLAIEYAYQFAGMQKNAWVFWIHASNQARVEESFKRVADIIRLPGRSEPGVNIASKVKNWLADERNGRWLMVLDSLDNPQVYYGEKKNDQSFAAYRYLPKIQQGSIILTTRNRDLAIRFGTDLQNVIEISPMTPDEALKLLKTKLKSPSDDDASRELVEALDFVPLAISHATAYIHKQQITTTGSVEMYLAEFHRGDRGKIRLLEGEVGDARRDEEASNAVLTTWEISFDRIRLERPSAADLLSLMSFFDRQGIPKSVLKASDISSNQMQKAQTSGQDSSNGKFSSLMSFFGRQDTPNLVLKAPDIPSNKIHKAPTNGLNSSDAEFDDDVILLRDYCLISVNKDGSEFDMHRLIQIATRRWLETSARREKPMQQCIERLAAFFPTGESENWEICRSLFPHVQHILDYKPVNGQADNWISLLSRAGDFAFLQGQDNIAERMLVAARESRIEKSGKDDPRTHTVSLKLANVLLECARYGEAENLGLQVMESRKRSLGKNHPETLESMCALSAIYRSQGRLEEAEKLGVRVMERRRKKLGKDDRKTLDAMHSLVLTYIAQGQWEKAEKLEVQVTDWFKKNHGKDHSNTLLTMTSVASIFLGQGRLQEAEGLFTEVVEGCKRTVEEDHSNTLTNMQNLALIYRTQGRWEEAEKLVLRLIKLQRGKLGEDHPDTLTSMSHLALAYSEQTQWEKAERLEAQVMDRRKRSLGRGHPATLTSMNNLACTWHVMGKTSEAIDLMRSCVALRQAKLPSGHRHTLESISHLAGWESR